MQTAYVVAYHVETYRPYRPHEIGDSCCEGAVSTSVAVEQHVTVLNVEVDPAAHVHQRRVKNVLAHDSALLDERVGARGAVPTRSAYPNNRACGRYVWRWVPVLTPYHHGDVVLVQEVGVLRIVLTPDPDGGSEVARLTDAHSVSDDRALDCFTYEATGVYHTTGT